jgi:predicted nucleic-acid-binding Zn-ribbon protein
MNNYYKVGSPECPKCGADGLTLAAHGTIKIRGGEHVKCFGCDNHGTWDTDESGALVDWEVER